MPETHSNAGPAAPSLLSCAEALRLVAAATSNLGPPPVEPTPLHEALGRVLAETVTADRDQPPFPRSTRDGFALRSADLAPGEALRVVGAIRAGEQWTGPALAPGQALEIMTGAPVPAGADAVLMLEHATRRSGAGSFETGKDAESQPAESLRPGRKPSEDGDLQQLGVLFPNRTLNPGDNIVPQGAEASSGQLLLSSGVRIGPAETALAASVGRPVLTVYKRPVVAILSTGDELVSVEEVPGPQQIRNSNAHALAALVRQNGGEPRILPIAADTHDALVAAVDQASGADMLILSGGVSAGKYDLVEPVLLSRGAEFLFTGVLMQPGKPAVFGRMTVRDAPRRGGSREQNAAAATEPASHQWIFGLPGNPVSTQVTAMLFAMPMLRALGGETRPEPTFAAAELAEPVSVRPGLTRFLPARLTGGLGGATICPTGWQGSGDLNANARANCYLVVPADVEGLDKGALVTALLR